MCMCVYMLVHEVTVRLKLASKYVHVCLHVSSSGQCVYMLVHEVSVRLKLACKYGHVCLHVSSSGQCQT